MPPRTATNVPKSGIRLSHRAIDGQSAIRAMHEESAVGVTSRLQDAYALPRHRVLLAAPPKRPPPDIRHAAPERTQRPDIGRGSSHPSSPERSALASALVG
jgi:hypothetical protein